MDMRRGTPRLSRRLAVAAYGALAALVLASCGTTTVVVTESPEATLEASPTASPSPSPSVSVEPVADAQSESSGSSRDTGSGSGSSTGGDSEVEPAAPEPEPEPEPDPEPAGPTVKVFDQRCSSAKLITVVTADAGSGYREGVQSVVMERQNEYSAWLDYDAQWLGPETGQGNQWTATINKLDGDSLRITAKASGGDESVVTVPVTVNC